MSKSTGIPVGNKATEAGNTKLLKAKYAMLRKDTGGFPSGSVVKNLLANAGDMDSAPESSPMDSVESGKVPHASE